MTISNGKLRFNTSCLKKFEDVEYVELLLNSVDRCVAIRPFTADGLNKLLHEAEEIMEGWTDTNE